VGGASFASFNASGEQIAQRYEVFDGGGYVRPKNVHVIHLSRGKQFFTFWPGVRECERPKIAQPSQVERSIAERLRHYVRIGGNILDSWAA